MNPHDNTLLAAGIVRALLKDCFDTPTQTLPDHLGFSISSIGKGALRVPERRCFALRRQARALLFEAANNRRLVDSDLLRRFSGAAISCLPAVPLAPFSSPRSLQRARAVQAKVFPLSSSCRQPALLAQLFRQEPREPARALARSTIYCPLHRRIGNHRLGFGVGTAPRGNEIERWMVGVARGARNDSAQGAQGVPPRLASERRSPARSHGQALSGQPGRLWSLAQNVIQVPSTYVRDQGPRT